MTSPKDDFEGLVSEADRREFTGWDFSYIRGRYEEARPHWDFRTTIKDLLRSSETFLDLGTGGGEFLKSVGPLPKTTTVTEGYKPNTLLALHSLREYDGSVVETYCDDNGPGTQRGALPFRDGSFDLVTDRHEAYIAKEVARVLSPGGTFATQQVGDGNNPELRAVFGTKKEGSNWDLERAKDEAGRAGLSVTASDSMRAKSRFLDVGALVYYMKAVAWEHPAFTVSRYERELREIHSKILSAGYLEVTTTRFFMVARKPS